MKIKTLVQKTRAALAVGGAIAVSFVAAPLAMAQTTGMDVSGVTTAVTDAGVAVATIGAAVLVVRFGAKAWHWIRGAG